MQARLRWMLLGLALSTGLFSPIGCRSAETADGAGGQSGDEGARPPSPVPERASHGEPALRP